MRECVAFEQLGIPGSYECLACFLLIFIKYAQVLVCLSILFLRKHQLSLLSYLPPSLPPLPLPQAQCIENLRPETFVKCLQNLWIGVTIINPLLSFLAISILPIPEINANSDTVLSRMAKVSSEWMFGEGSSMAQLFSDWMSIEAFCVLSGGR